MASSVLVRELEKADYDRGYIALLNQLTSSPEVTREAFERHVDVMVAQGNYIVVAVDTESGTLLGTGKVLIEHKLTHGCSSIGHVEDIVTTEASRGRGVGRKVIEALVAYTRDQGCYKVILDCTEANSGFYAKLGFVKKEIQMVQYFE